MHRNRGFPPISSAVSVVRAARHEDHARQAVIKSFREKRERETGLQASVRDLRMRWTEFRDRIREAFLETSSDEKERLAAQVREAEDGLQEQLDKNHEISSGIECLLKIYCVLKKYNDGSSELRTRIEALVEDINRYISRGQIVGYYSALANSFHLIHDSYLRYLDSTIQIKKLLIVEDTDEKDSLISSKRHLEEELQEVRDLMHSWEKNVVAAKDRGSDELYASTHLKTCIPHFVEIYGDLAPDQQPLAGVAEQVQRINYTYLHMKAIIKELKRIKSDDCVPLITASK